MEFQDRIKNFFKKKEGFLAEVKKKRLTEFSFEDEDIAYIWTRENVEKINSLYELVESLEVLNKSSEEILAGMMTATNSYSEIEGIRRKIISENSVIKLLKGILAEITDLYKNKGEPKEEWIKELNYHPKLLVWYINEELNIYRILEHGKRIFKVGISIYSTRERHFLLPETREKHYYYLALLLKHFKDIRYVEVYEEKLTDDEKEWLLANKDEGYVFTVHAPFVRNNLCHVDPAYRARSLKEVLRAIEFASELGARCVTIHSGEQWLKDYDMMEKKGYLCYDHSMINRYGGVNGAAFTREAVLDRVVESLKTCAESGLRSNPNMKINLETLPGKIDAAGTIEDFEYLLKNINMPNVGITLDFAHLAITSFECDLAPRVLAERREPRNCTIAEMNRNFLDYLIRFYKRLAHYINYIHIQDCLMDPKIRDEVHFDFDRYAIDDSHEAFGDGDLPVNDMLHFLKNTGYRDILTLEVWKKHQIEKTINFLRRYLEQYT